jgi:PAS domain S-box-containing protein
MARIQARPTHVTPSSAPSRWNQSDGAARGDEARLLMLAESVGHMGHWQWTLSTDKLTWSDQLFEIYGVDPQTFPLTFAAAFDLCHPQDRKHAKEILDRAVTGRESFEIDYRIQRPDGTRTVICKGQPEYDASGAVVGLYGVLADVTDAFAAIRAIHDQNEMLGLAAHLAHLGHWIWSQDESRLTFCSEELARIHDLSPDDMGGYAHPAQLATTIVLADRSRYLAAVAAALAAPCAYEIEYQLESADGARKFIREIGQPIVDDQGKLRRFIGTVQDISEAKRRENELARAEEELKRRTAELQESNRQKDTLFSIIAHDLRSPFNSVIGFADLLASSAKDLPAEKIGEYAQIVRDAAGDVHTLLDNLLAWAAIQIRDAGLKFTAVDLAVIAARGTEPLARMAEVKGVSVTHDVAGVTVMGDADLICIVLRNLVSNGIKFSEAGGAVRISAAPTACGRFVCITVRDDGVGMSSAAKADLFALHTATSQTGTYGEKGAGIGLYLCRDIVSRHGGEISVDSAPGRGTAFHFTLPAIQK